VGGVLGGVAFGTVVGIVALRTVVGAAEVTGVGFTVSEGNDGSSAGTVGAALVSTMTCGVDCAVVLGSAAAVVTLTGGVGSADTLGSVGNATTDVDVTAVDDGTGAVLMTTS